MKPANEMLIPEESGGLEEPATRDPFTAAATAKPSSVFSCLAVLIYGTCWLTPRLDAILKNVMWGDDYWIPSNPFVYMRGFRPLLTVEYLFWEAMFPGHFWTTIPKWSGAAYLVAVAFVMFRLLGRWGVPPALALAMPAIFLSHPILADIGLFQNHHAGGLAMLLLVAGYAALPETSNHRRSGLGFVLMLLGILGYQIYATIPFILAAAQCLITAITGLACEPIAQIRKATLAVLASVVQMIYMVVSRVFLARPDARGFVAFNGWQAYCDEKWHGAFNLVVNGFTPVVAYYQGPTLAFSQWKWVPLGVVCCALIAGALRGGLRGGFVQLAGTTLLIALPASPILLMNFNPYAWRVSAPVVLGTVLAMVPTLLMLNRTLRAQWPGIAVVMLTLGTLVPATRFDSEERVLANLADREIVRAAQAHWGPSSHDVRSFAIALPPVQRVPRPRAGPTLTVGYDRITLFGMSAFSDPWVAQNYVERFLGLRFLDCAESNGATESSGCSGVAAACTLSSTPLLPDDAPWRLVHIEGARVSVLCPRDVG